MRFAFTDDQLAFRDVVRDLLANEFPASALRTVWDTDTAHDPVLWRSLADLGVVGITVPEAQGGLGLGDLDLVLLLEEAGRAALSEPLAATAAVSAPLLAAIGGDEAERWLAKIALGEATVALAVDDELVLDADTATILLHVTDHRITLHEASDLELERQPSVDEARHLFRVAWTTQGTLLADGDMAEPLYARACDRGAIASAAELLGLAERMLDMTVEYVQERKQFGVPIGSFQAIKHHLADTLLALEFARPLVYAAAYSSALDLPSRSVDASMAKASASDAAHLVARQALQCHGAIAYTVEYDLHMWMKRTWALAAAWGDPRTHRARVAASVLGADSAH